MIFCGRLKCIETYIKGCILIVYLTQKYMQNIFTQYKLIVQGNLSISHNVFTTNFPQKQKAKKKKTILLGLILLFSWSWTSCAIWARRLASSSSNAIIFCCVKGSDEETADTESTEISQGVDVLSSINPSRGGRNIPSSTSSMGSSGEISSSKSSCLFRGL